MKIDNVKVYGLWNSITASGLPMIAEYDEVKFEKSVDCEDGKERAVRLASCAGGESHDCYLAGVVVQANITAPRYFYAEMCRYHFIDIVSSTSTMHRLKAFVEKAIALQDAGKMDEYEKLVKAHFSPHTHPAVINGFMTLAGGLVKQENVDIETLKANLPEGWLQTARITTNYRQLKTIYHQRKSHRLQEWRDFCAWIETLPMARELICGGKDNGKSI